MVENSIIKNKKANQIEKFLKDHPHYPSLYGFKDYISNMSDCSIFNYLFYVSAFLDFCGKEPNDITEDDYSNYLMSLKQKTPSYQTVAYASLKKYSNYLFTSKINTQNPMQNIKRPDATERIQTIEKRQNGYLTKAEIQQILIAIKNGVGNNRSKKRQKEWRDRDYLMFLIFLSTGIRLSTLIELNVDDIDFKNKQLKTENGTNIFPLSEDAIVYAEWWLKKRSELLGDKDEQALFISINRERMSETAVMSVIQKYSSVIPGKHITPNNLRATFANQVYNKTHDIYLTQKAMHHKTLSSTEKYVKVEQT